MSLWGNLDARFRGVSQNFPAADYISQQVPSGSEHGPGCHTLDDGTVVVHGPLRDVRDFPDSLQVLAWFAKMCDVCAAESADLDWEIDTADELGPSTRQYRFRYEAGELRRVRPPAGVLDDVV